VYLHGGAPGLRRERRGRRVVYLTAGGELVDDPDTIARIEALRIPPAWTDVWISADPRSHLQATGIDAKGRRQYLYHPVWRERRDQEKFDDMLDFAAGLPALRRIAYGRLDHDALDRDHALALAVRMLDVGFFRIGWDRYARDNGHVGLTTLRREHVTLGASAARFDFIAKSGKHRRMTVRDPQSVRALVPLKRRRGSPPELLVFRTGGGWRRIHAPDVNNALRQWAGGPYSAKEFRTWAATVLAAVALARERGAGRHGKRAVSRAVREVATALGNTPTVARASYIDPRVIDAYERGDVIELPDDLGDAAAPRVIDAGDGGVVIEFPAGVDRDTARDAVELRVRELISSTPRHRPRQVH
jgi:DNA topoisomerase IB